MKTSNLGYPRIGDNRELKKACESYWSGTISEQELIHTGKEIRHKNWQLQKEQGIDFIPSNDFSFYDQVLDFSLMVGAVPPRYAGIRENPEKSVWDLYFAMARGVQKAGDDVVAMEMTKWFDTNYHYIVPEFYSDQQFELLTELPVDYYKEARALGIETRPVLLGPVSYLLLGKVKKGSFDALDLLPSLLEVYGELLQKLQDAGAEWIQIDEPFLALDLADRAKRAFSETYETLRERFPALKIMLATYFEGLRENAAWVAKLPVCALHVDLVRAPEQLDTLLELIPEQLSLSLGVVDGRNVWKNDYKRSLALIRKAEAVLGAERIFVAPSCSLLHAPCDLDLETNEKVLSPEIKQWLAFAKQKLKELTEIRLLAEDKSGTFAALLDANQKALENRKTSPLIHHAAVKQRVGLVDPTYSRRTNAYPERRQIQQRKLQLPLFPTTTIGSFPQTKDIRQLRARLKNGSISREDYERQIRDAIAETIRVQEEIGLDVLVHGEFERNDMVEYFGELLQGYTFTSNGWVQSYGSRCVKPPVIFGDVYRDKDLSVGWTSIASQYTDKPMKGMLTGPVTMLQWSFVRDDQPRSVTCLQIALAIRDEVVALEEAGVAIIQIDEPAIREGLPLRQSDWEAYLNWAVQCFKVSSCGVKDDTQIHTHMCYSEFNDIIEHIAAMDADVITIETSRSEMELLDAFVSFRYPNEIGPGVYDIHSPRVPQVKEMEYLLKKALEVLPAENIWVNPDCGLKTRNWPETEAALKNMVEAARLTRDYVKRANFVINQ